LQYDPLQVEFLGCGVMIGSAFAVILPEGYEALYSASKGTLYVHEESMGAERRLLVEDVPEHAGNNHNHVEVEPGISRWVPGVALLSGFLAMMVFEFMHHKMEHGKVRHQNNLFSCSKVRARMSLYVCISNACLLCVSCFRCISDGWVAVVRGCL
jgi:hypothetical protein